jgi:response regulator RpfG family c-di-GMP phosphodiesterase
MNTNRLKKITKSIFLQRVLLSLIGTTVNVLLAFHMNKWGFPLFLDTIGTIAVASMGGLFPGILTAVVTNSICALFNTSFIYYGFLNAMIAIFTAWFVRRHAFKKLWKVLVFILVLALFSGSLSALINWFLLSGAQSARNSETVLLFSSSMGLSLFWSYFIYNIILNLFDKGISVFVSGILLTIIPKRVFAFIEQGNWKQRPIDEEEIKVLNAWGKDMPKSMRLRTTLIIIVTSVVLVIVTGWSGVSTYFYRIKEAKTIDGLNTLQLFYELVDPSDIEAVIANGNGDPKYEEIMGLLQTIVDNSDSVEKMHIIKFTEKEGKVIFDVCSSKYGKVKKTAVLKYDDQIRAWLPQLLSGEEVSPMEHGDLNSWMRSIYYPIKNEKGECICYGIADISLTYMADYMQNFIIRSLLILFGFFILVLANNVWYTNMLMVYPIRSLSKCVDEFSNMGYEQEQLDKNVKNIRALEICTEDEVEKLYKSICKMTLNLSEQMRDLRRLSESTAKMQDGLIITMADMVERRDSDTGEHIQKTALYVKIIVEGLKKKGYYAEKITPKFMSDVVRSAPLHDIGKINIPDGILNKPGKLTPEEFDIMKTHTTAGKKIMEDAISTVQGENYLKEARNMAAYHHERWDGKGYPDGLHGEVIPLSARIMAVADVFDALTSPRVYKPAFPLDKALNIITEEAGKQFDPKCVEVFMESLPEVKVILKKYNNV